MWDQFFYYGYGAVEDENAFELQELVLQPDKSLFYFRSYGVDHKYNYPVASFNQILIAYSIASAIAQRNQEVSDGSTNQDRRIAASQQSIVVTDGQNGERDIKVYYFNYANYQAVQTINTSVV